MTAIEQRRFASLDPRTGAILDHYPLHDADAVNRAVELASAAATWWVAIGFAARKKRLDAWRKLILHRMSEGAELISAETGKPLEEAKLELGLTTGHVHWAAAHAKRVLGKRRVSSSLLLANHAASIEYHPLGVVGVIGPWNYPMFTPMGSISYALAAGNAVVFKPSELTPGVGTWLAQTFAEIVPEYPVFTVVTGEGETGAALCQAGVQKLAFTGSTATAKKVMAACAEKLTPVLLECGGKDALIVDNDADLVAAADAALWGAVVNAGQTCVGVERVYVVDEIANTFIAEVVKRAKALRPGVDFGPITMPSQLEIIRNHMQDAVERGGKVLLGGVDAIKAPYVLPTVLVDVPEDSIANTEETFGPTVTIKRVRDVKEAVELVNASRYGLGAAVFSRSRGEQLARRLRVGMVAVNSVVTFAAVPTLPFGGVGDSGFGRIHGADGLREFARPQAVSRKLFSLPTDPTSFFRNSFAARLLLRIIRLRYGR